MVGGISSSSSSSSSSSPTVAAVVLVLVVGPGGIREASLTLAQFPLYNDILRAFLLYVARRGDEIDFSRLVFYEGFELHRSSRAVFYEEINSPTRQRHVFYDSREPSINSPTQLDPIPGLRPLAAN